MGVVKSRSKGMSLGQGGESGLSMMSPVEGNRVE